MDFATLASASHLSREDRRAYLNAMAKEEAAVRAQLLGPQPNSAYERQGRSARMLGMKASDCPYYATSTASTHWRKGFGA